MSGLVVQGLVEGAQEGAQVRLTLGSREEVCSVDAEGRFRIVVDMFGSGGAQMLAEKHGFPVLGTVPLDPAVRIAGDAGEPIVVADPDSPIAQSFREAAGKAAQRIAVRSFASLPVLD
jgi:hypothetical protein